MPVKVFQGSLEEARFAALKANSWDKLPMNLEDKLEAVWRFVKEEGGHSKQQLTDLGLGVQGNHWQHAGEVDRDQSSSGRGGRLAENKLGASKVLEGGSRDQTGRERLAGTEDQGMGGPQVAHAHSGETHFNGLG